MVHYLNDVINILKVLVLDKSPEVRKVACECVSVYALAAKEKFQMQSSSLIKPLLKSLQHQRFRIRVASIMALGDIALYGEDKGLEEISGPLTQCFLDLPQVRLAVVSVGGILALKLPDRYSYWHRILPLILTGLIEIIQERDGWADCTFLDLQKAFDKVPHKKLIRKIEIIGGIQDCIEPHLSWHAGNTAGALRTASISCLLALCTNSVLQNCHLSDILLVLGRLSPNTVVPALEKEAPNFFNQHLCAKLIEQITKNKQS
ncbi:dynein axonemal assembly factor 5 [Oratosquilla oratoria]|uniref:dynein axonemal assembly factor 5 n=1 Tax=Oratosquilla oratoria TaxID=337810 RepID=UPI003F771A06